MTTESWTDARAPHGAGALDARFAAVGEAFAANFAEEFEFGASFAAIIDGETVVDIRAGFRDRRSEIPWTDDTIASIYSSGKAALWLLVAREVARGRLDYDAPVAAYWPEFAAEGKDKITVAEALSHQAGLCALPAETPPEIYYDWDACCAAIAVMAPLWPPGTANGYHPQTFGFIAGEILRRLTGQSVGALLRDYGGGDLQLFCGLEPDEIERAAQMTKPPRPPDLGDLTALKRGAFLERSAVPPRAGRPEWMAAQIPGSNMHGDARSLARALQPMVNGGHWRGEQILTAEAITAARAGRIRGDDLVLPFHLSWAAGVMRNINRHFGPNENALGHAGFGGSCVVIDPENRLTAAYVMNKMSPYLVGDPRALRLINALYESL